jgi:dethiobiotin synthetase
MVKGFFITGTDTGVGKTVIAGALIKTAQSLGLKVCGMKPLETGCKKINGALFPSDGDFLKKMSDVDEPLSLITPCAYENPLAPMVAADIEKKLVNLTAIKDSFKNLSEKYQSVMVEGIGGLLVPITRNYFVIDLIKELNLPVIMVSKPGIGAINHTLLTLNYALINSLNVAGIIINYTQAYQGTIAEDTNMQAIMELSPVPVIGSFPYLTEVSDKTLVKAALENLDINVLKRYLLC